jgi:hypothetical protein
VRLNKSLPFVQTPDGRYAYFTVPLKNPSFSQAVSATDAAAVNAIAPGCRELFREKYCGSRGEEFVSTDPTESAYLDAYVRLLEQPQSAAATMVMEDPQHYRITVRDATPDTAIVVKMTYDDDFTAHIVNEGKPVPVSTIGPYFILLTPNESGDYEVILEYHVNKAVVVGAWTSAITVLLLALIFLFRPKLPKIAPRFRQGDL